MFKQLQKKTEQEVGKAVIKIGKKAIKSKIKKAKKKFFS